MPSCSPTRSILLTGTDNHLAGLGAQQGGFTQKQKGQPGYEGYLNHRVATLPEVLQTAGYRTYMSGKWHLGHDAEHAPSKRGFQETFALMPGGASHYADRIPLHPAEPAVYRRNGKVVETLADDFYSTKDYTDNLLSWLARDTASTSPFFAYLAYTAPHDPLHAPETSIKKYDGVYDDGYEVLRRKRFEQLKNKGLIDSTQTFPTWPSLIPKWSELSDTRKRIEIRDMQTYAAMIDYMDEQIGRVYNWLAARGTLDNTLIIFMSDNGAAGLDSRKIYPSYTKEFASQFNNELSNRGLPNSFTNVTGGWAVASSTIFRDFKGFPTEGGIRTPMFIKPIGNLKHSKGKDVCATFTHVRDLMPTILDLTNAKHPSLANTELIKMLGRSLVPVIKNPRVDIHKGEGIGYELHGSRAFMKDGWKITQSPMPVGNGEWELFNLKEDPTEQTNLIFKQQDKFNELLAGYENFEKEVGVIYDLPSILGITKKVFNIIFCLLVAVFSLAILGKLSGKLKPKYLEWGYGIPFMYALAVGELMGLIGLFTSYNQYAAWFLLAIMGGALFTLLKNKEPWKAYLLMLFATVLLGLFILLKSGYLITTLL